MSPYRSDNDVGSSQNHVHDDFKQNSQQEELTRINPRVGMDEKERSDIYQQTGGIPGRSPVVTGGSSQGMSDQNDGVLGQDPDDESRNPERREPEPEKLKKIAGGHYESEQNPGTRDLEQDQELRRSPDNRE